MCHDLKEKLVSIITIFKSSLSLLKFKKNLCILWKQNNALHASEQVNRLLFWTIKPTCLISTAWFFSPENNFSIVNYQKRKLQKLQDSLYICSYFCSSFLCEHSISSNSWISPKEKVLFTHGMVLNLTPLLQRLVPLFCSEICICIIYYTEATTKNLYIF